MSIHFICVELQDTRHLVISVEICMNAAQGLIQSLLPENAARSSLKLNEWTNESPHKADRMICYISTVYF